MGKRHHFVPRFYLTGFSRSSRRIDLFNLQRGKVIPGVSLRDQCYAHRLYGADDEVENILAEIEGLAARVLEGVRNRNAVPGGGTPGRDTLMLFIALQLARTTAAHANTIASSQLMADVAFDGSPPEDFAMRADEAMRIMLGLAPTIATTLRDLSITLVLAGQDSAFVTSDNPVFKYNSYCEGITDLGVTGTACRGLQVFFPVSPRILLYLFDASVYELNRPRNHVIRATSKDMEALNRLQLIAAQDNVYFSNPELGPWLMKSAADVAAIRGHNRSRVTRAVDVGNERSELLHQYQPMPQLQLELSFVAVRRDARRVPLFDRAQLVRKPYDTRGKGDIPSGIERRFEVKSRH